MIVFIHKQYNIDNKISIMKHSFTESTSRICHTTGFYVCNSEYTLIISSKLVEIQKQVML